jgi:hypothetical protein
MTAVQISGGEEVNGGMDEWSSVEFFGLETINGR